MSDYIQLTNFRGTPNRSKNSYHMLLDDFYTLCMKDPKNNIGLRKQSKNKHGVIIFKLSDTSLDYLCSDFVRFCLSLYKNQQNLFYREMSLIPKEPIPISDELEEYIREFLPDFYNIRK